MEIFLSFPSAAWECNLAKRRLANLPIGDESGIGRINQRGEAALRGTHSQAALGNDKGTEIQFPA